MVHFDLFSQSHAADELKCFLFLALGILLKRT